MRNVVLAVLVAVIGLIAVSASAEVNFGGDARFLAMGGAGIAATDSPRQTALMNPAALGMLPKRVRFVLPNISLRAEGANANDFIDFFTDVLTNPDNVEEDLAREFGKRDTIFDVGAATGISGSPLSLLVDAEARVRISPNAAFRQWAQTGVLPTDPTQMEAEVWIEQALAMPSLSLGFQVPKFASGKGDLWIGTRVRLVRGEYLRRTITWSGSLDPDNLLQTSNEPVKDESGLGADLGIIYRTDNPSRLSYGLVVTNLLKPDLGEIEQDTIWSVGIAMQPNSRTLLVADLVNLTQAYGDDRDLRLGVEFKPHKKIALRAGYSGEALTTGIGLFGFDFAFSNDTPLSVARTIRF
ncbi:MAG TPA: conjugal transfer protein TraF [Armatimonadota bacterium]|nr:conjugal transfer protein TraF [Armatimonadota bacterium]HOP79444.1 conjugal transfer protein TraF [Armatimonadota bacterium]